MVATTQPPPSTASPMPQLNSCFDPSDIDSFINYDQAIYPSPSLSPSQSRGKSAVGQNSSSSSSSSSFGSSSQSSQQFFSGPSHQYDSYKQQTGLPVGGLANTLAVNQTNNLQFGGNSVFAMPTESSYFGVNTTPEDFLDFGSGPSRNFSVGDTSEMDFEADSPDEGLPAYFFPTSSSTATVDPTAIGGQEESSSSAPNVQRMYPGMHSQQAAMAKAQQQQRQEMLRQQQQRQMESQRTQQPARQNRAAAHQPNDPLVEERISRLLHQMRQGSVNSQDDDDPTTPTANGLPHIAKMKKEEEDMDEDERLLASEEGKKLSSKERRQLRNKVSARAFRSRRKEYIGQLEGEVAAKANEANDLRVQNRALMEENQRLTDLTRMLLASPSFSTFLNDLSSNGLPAPSIEVPSRPVTQAPAPQPTRKDVNPNRAAQEMQNQQNTSQVGMAMVPEQNLDFSMLDINVNGWNSGLDMTFNNAQVFAVTEVPEGPAIDTSVLSGKSESFSTPSSRDCKEQAPVIERMPVIEETDNETASVSSTDVDLDASDPAFALFIDTQPAKQTTEPFEDMFGGVELEKVFSRVELIVNDESQDVIDVERHDILKTTVVLRSGYLTIKGSSLKDLNLFSSVLSIPLVTLAPSSLTLLTTITRLRFGLRRVIPLTFAHSGYYIRSFKHSIPLKNYDKAFSGLSVLSLRNSVSDIERPNLPPTQPHFSEPSLTNAYPAPAILRRWFKGEPQEIIYKQVLEQSDNPNPSALQSVHPMKFYFQVQTTPTSDTPGTTLYLHFDNKRYLFGQVSEGTQRACIERGTKLSKLTDVFLTGKTEWTNTGGLIGMILTLADAADSAKKAAAEERRKKAEKREIDALRNGLDPIGNNDGSANGTLDTTLNLHGGANLMHTLATARRFVFRKGMPVSINEFEERGERELEKPTWCDENINVWALPISPSSSQQRLVSPKSPRKRSLDDFQERAANGSVEDVPDKKARDQQLRKAVVSEMFNSSWRLDALVETPVSEVKMPAALFIKNPETKKIENYTGPKPGDSKPLPDVKVLVRRPWPGALIEYLPPTEPSEQAMSYIIKGYPVRGKFLPQKAKALGLQPGRTFSMLTEGHTVEAPDGTKVTPDMVMGDPRPGHGLAIVDLPSVGYVENLVNRPEWKSPEVMKGIESIIWILGPGVSSHPQLLQFVANMKNVKHLVSSRDHCPNYLSLDSSAASAIRLSRLDRHRFPVPIHDNETLPQIGYGGDISPEAKSLFQPAERGIVIQLEPQFKLLKDEVPHILNTAQVVQTTSKEITKCAREAREELARPEVMASMDETQRDLPGKDTEIITLGTGSALPSKYRNVSATLLRVPGYGSYLFDCGENTLGQLRRVFEPAELADILRDLKMIWISHLHADHHLGTASVIKAWYKEVHGGISSSETPSNNNASDLDQILTSPNTKPLFIISEINMLHWLHEYSTVEDFGYTKLIPLATRNLKLPDGTLSPIRNCVSWQNQNIIFDTHPALRHATCLSNLLTCNVSHCLGAKAVSLVFPNGFKFSYSGDCRPSAAFAEIGKGSTVLLHEATFDDEMAGDAKAKKHSTTSEALGVGVEMRARRVLLTHFSQRYQKLPVLGNAFGKRIAFEDATVAAANGESGEGMVEPEEGGMNGPAVSEISAPAAGDVDGEQLPSELHTQNGGTTGEEANGKVKWSPLPSTSDTPMSDPPSTPTHSVPAKGEQNDIKVGVAFDYMRVKVGDINKLEWFREALGSLFAQDTGVDVDVKEGSEAEKVRNVNRMKGKREGRVMWKGEGMDREGKERGLYYMG